MTQFESFGLPALVSRLYPVLPTVLMLSRQREEAFMKICQVDLQEQAAFVAI